MNGKILLVDDEDTLRLATQVRLQSKGYDVTTAADGEEALELLQAETFDVALLDINMPRMNGLQVLDYITQSRPQTDVVMLTGFADFSTALECLKKGARDYLVKPVDMAELISRVNAILRARHSEQALNEYRQENAGLQFYGILSPLITITAILETVASSPRTTTTDEDKELLQYTRRLAEQALTRLKDVADLSLLQSLQRPIDGRSANLNAVVKTATERYAALAKLRGIIFKREVQQDLPSVAISPLLVEGALNNAFDHAFRYVAQGGLVKFSVLRNDDAEPSGTANSLVFSISYTGTDLDPTGRSMLQQGAEKLFKRASEFETTVLALTAWRQLIETVGGRFWMERDDNAIQRLNFALPITAS